MVKRMWIPIDRVDIFTDPCHSPDGEGGFVAHKEHDGQDTEEHRKQIEYIKKVLVAGQKIRPILVADTNDGHYTRLDGFKRIWGAKELGEKYIEAFVCTQEEFRDRVEIPYGNSVIRCDHGGLPKEDFGLFENNATESFDYDKIEFLYKSEKPDGLRIEMDEAIHVHWHTAGAYRLLLGRKDFEALAEAVSKI